MPCRTGILSLLARAATTGFCSVDRMRRSSPDLRRAAMPRPSPRWTATISRPSASIRTRSSVWVPSKSRTTASMSSRVGSGDGSRSGARARARARSCGSSISRTRAGSVRTSAVSPKKRWRWVRKPHDVHRVRRAGLQQVLGAVLPHLPDALVVVDAVGVVLDGGAVAPYEAVEGGHGDGRVGAFAGDRCGHPVDVLASDERAGALDQQHHVDGAAVHRLVRVEGVQHRVLAARPVARDGGGTLHAVQPPGLPQRVARGPCGGGDGRVVGRHDDVGDLARSETGLHRAGDQRYAADLGDVLGRDALGSAAGGDHGEHGRGRGHLCS